MLVTLVNYIKAIDFQIMNRYYSWKLQFLHVNASNLQGGNISLPNNFPLVLPFEGFPLMTKQVTNSFFILSFTPKVSEVLLRTVLIQKTLND